MECAQVTWQLFDRVVSAFFVHSRASGNPDLFKESAGSPPSRGRTADLKLPSRKQRDLINAHRLGETQHYIHVLHRLAGGALGEIVERRADDGTTRDAVL